jgi:RNA polymerase sigma-70 factor, ECF subfamily
LHTEAELKALMTAGLGGDADAHRRLLAALAGRLRGYFRKRLHVSLPLTPWVHALARYKLIDHLRRSGARPTAPLDDADAVMAEDVSEAADARRDVAVLLARLPERQRALVTAVKLEGRSVEETAARFGLSESGVKVTVHRSLKRLARFVGGASDAD